MTYCVGSYNTHYTSKWRSPGAPLQALCKTQLQVSEHSEYFNTSVRKNSIYVIKCMSCRPIDQNTSLDAAM